MLSLKGCKCDMNKCGNCDLIKGSKCFHIKGDKCDLNKCGKCNPLKMANVML